MRNKGKLTFMCYQFFYILVGEYGLKQDATVVYMKYQCVKLPFIDTTMYSLETVPRNYVTAISNYLTFTHYTTLIKYSVQLIKG